LAFIGKAVWGSVSVAFNSGAEDIGTPFWDRNLFIIQCKWQHDDFSGNKPGRRSVYCLWTCESNVDGCAGVTGSETLEAAGGRKCLPFSQDKKGRGKA
jgi:hypothetical protein